MKYLALFLFFLYSCSSNNGRLPSSDFINIVLDIDWTITSQVDESFAKEFPEKVIVVGDEFYRPYDGLAEMLETLADNPQVRVFFFSGGHEERNIDLLSKIKLKDGRSALSISEGVYSRHHLIDLRSEVGEDAKFAEKYKKDLLSISKDLKNTVIFDDNHFFSPDLKQRKNFLWLEPSYNHYETWAMAKKALDQDPQNKYIPKTFEHWSLHRNKMAMIYGVIERAMTEGEGNFSERIRRNWDELDILKGTYSKDAFYYHDQFQNKKGALKVAPNDDCAFLVKMLL